MNTLTIFSAAGTSHTCHVTLAFLLYQIHDISDHFRCQPVLPLEDIVI